MGAAIALSACAEDAPQPALALAALPAHAEHTRDGVVTADVPGDLHVSMQERSLWGTSADGSFRLYLEHRPGEPLAKVLGGQKDELLGLGWELIEEQHFANAVMVQMAQGKKPRLLRQLWILEASGRVVVCEAIASELQVVRLGLPLRRLCQSLRIEPVPAP